jgi:hypothetical protein
MNIPIVRRIICFVLMCGYEDAPRGRGGSDARIIMGNDEAAEHGSHD